MLMLKTVLVDAKDSEAVLFMRQSKEHFTWMLTHTIQVPHLNYEVGLKNTNWETQPITLQGTTFKCIRSESPDELKRALTWNWTPNLWFLLCLYSEGYHCPTNKVSHELSQPLGYTEMYEVRMGSSNGLNWISSWNLILTSSERFSWITKEL